MTIAEDFRKLIETNKAAFTDEIYGLFNDSLRCFNAGIYRPAFLLAYQGLMQRFRYIVLNGKKPTAFDEGKWKGVISNLKNDKEFDDEVFKCIQRKNAPTATPPEVAILHMPDELRADFDFWRRRRNDCAHYKDYDINCSQVLSFYSLMNQYLLKISMEGGKATLLKEFEEACDTTKHSPNESLKPLVDKIVAMVSPEEMYDFFDALPEAMQDWFDNRFLALMNSILNGDDAKLKEYVVAYMRSSKQLVKFLEIYPEMVGVLVEKEKAREFWTRSIESSRYRMRIFAHLIMVGLIRQEDVPEAINKVVTYCYNNNQGFYNVSDAEWEVLVHCGILDALKKSYYNVENTERNAKEYGRRHYSFFEGTIRYLPLNLEWVKIIVGIFSAKEYPTVWLNIYRDNILKDEYYSKFTDICKANDIAIPAVLTV